MKTIFRTVLVVLITLLIKTVATAQVNIDETNLITRLSGLDSLTIAGAGKYFADRGYSFSGKSTFNQPAFSMDSYSYTIKGQTDMYNLNVMAGQVVGSGLITYNDDEYRQALKIIRQMGYVPTIPNTPDSGETIYSKGNMHFVVDKKALNNGSTFYVLNLVDLLKQRQLSGVKK